MSKVETGLQINPVTAHEIINIITFSPIAIVCFNVKRKEYVAENRRIKGHLVWIHFCIHIERDVSPSLNFNAFRDDIEFDSHYQLQEP